MKKLPLSSSSPRDLWASMMDWASSARTGTNLIAVMNAKLNSKGILAFSRARLSLSGEVVRKKRENEVMRTRKRTVIARAYSRFSAVRV